MLASVCFDTINLTLYMQAQVLVTSDVDAMYHVIVKHVDIFDSVDYFRE